MRPAVLTSFVTLGILPFGTPSYAGLDPTCPLTWSEGASSGVWETVQIREPFSVRAVRGTIANEGGGSWPSNVDIVIELADIRQTATRYLTHARVRDGKFEIRRVPPGEYCFRVGVRPPGWSNVEGRILLSRNAQRKARVDVTIPLGQ